MNDVVKQEQFTLMPKNYSEAERYSILISKSGFCPNNLRGKPQDVFLAIQMGMELGLQPVQSLQNIAVINGRPSIWGDAALAVCQNHPLWNGILEMSFAEAKQALEKIEKKLISFEALDELMQEALMRAELKSTQGYICVVKRKNEGAAVRTFSIEDAKLAGLWDKAGPWKNYPERMLQLRARGFALRDKFADALKGLITREEAQDYPAPDEKPVKKYNRPALPASNNKKDAAPKGEVIDHEAIDSATETGELPTPEEFNELLSLISLLDVSEDRVNKWLRKAKVENLEVLPREAVQKCIAALKEESKEKPLSPEEL